MSTRDFLRRCRVCGAEVIAGPYIAPEACGSCQLTANAESERLHHERGGGVSEITPEMIYRVAELHGTIKQQAAEIERLKALAIRAWDSFRTGGCRDGLTDADIMELMRLAADADAKLRKHPPA
jgi:hypothetical protein